MKNQTKSRSLLETDTFQKTEQFKGEKEMNRKGKRSIRQRHDTNLANEQLWTATETNIEHVPMPEDKQFIAT